MAMWRGREGKWEGRAQEAEKQGRSRVRALKVFLNPA